MLPPATPLPGTSPPTDPTGLRIGIFPLSTRIPPGRRCEPGRADGAGLIDTRPRLTASEGR